MINYTDFGKDRAITDLIRQQMQNPEFSAVYNGKSFSFVKEAKTAPLLKILFIQKIWHAIRNRFDTEYKVRFETSVARLNEAKAAYDRVEKLFKWDDEEEVHKLFYETIPILEKIPLEKQLKKETLETSLEELKQKKSDLEVQLNDLDLDTLTNEYTKLSKTLEPYKNLSLSEVEKYKGLKLGSNEASDIEKKITDRNKRIAFKFDHASIYADLSKLDVLKKNLDQKNTLAGALQKEISKLDKSIVEVETDLATIANEIEDAKKNLTQQKENFNTEAASYLSTFEGLLDENSKFLFINSQEFEQAIGNTTQELDDFENIIKLRDIAKKVTYLKEIAIPKFTFVPVQHEALLFSNEDNLINLIKKIKL